MQHRSIPLRNVLRASLTVVALSLTACGGSDAADDASTVATTEASASTDEDEAADPGAGAETVAAGGLESTAACLTDGGFTIAAADESNTGMSAGMLENQGIAEMLVFTAPDGSAGSIAAYTSADGATAAEEEGVFGSTSGFQQRRVDEVLFRTTGAASALDAISGCLAGTPIPVDAAGDDEAAPAETTPSTTAAAETMEPPATEPATDDTTDDTGDPAGDDTDSGDGETAAAAEVPEPVIADDLDAARAFILANLMSPERIAQDVVFDPTCLDGWVRVFSDGDAEAIRTNLEAADSDAAPVSAEGEAQMGTALACLDVGYLAALNADFLDADRACVDEAFAALDLDDVVAEVGADINEVWRVFSDVAFDACG